MNDRDTLKLGLVDAALHGYQFRISSMDKFSTIYTISDTSFWTVAHFKSNYPATRYYSKPLALKDALALIDQHWEGMEVNNRTLEELTFWIPLRRKNASVN
jgi:hypothetical protein